MLQDLGDFEGAYKLSVKSVQIFEATLPKGHPHIAKAKGNLASIEAAMKGK